jgi:electron transport complex protein RnfC
MAKVLTFPKGGIHPPSRKTINPEFINNIAMPGRVVIPLSQHIGTPAELLVKVGDEVREDQLIGKAAGFVSANIHSPLSGTVEEIRSIYLPSGTKTDAVVIAVSSDMKKYSRRTRNDQWMERSDQELLSIINDRGIVGLGGATFPTHVKLTLPRGKECSLFIVNAAECEPYLVNDFSLMLHKPAEILEGVQIVRKILKPGKTVIGIEKDKIQAARQLEEKIRELGLDGIEIVLLKKKYPQGAEKNLIKAITGKEVPSGKLPLEIGMINLNVSTLFAIQEAVVFNKALTSRLITVGGGAVANPSVVQVTLGTPVGQILDECGGLKKPAVKYVMGGPMMGFSFHDPETPVIKGTSGILALTKEETLNDRETPCIGCARCISACPMGLVPTQLFKMVRAGAWNEALSNGLLDCVECGCCSWVCPARIPLVQSFKAGKKLSRQFTAGKTS